VSKVRSVAGSHQSWRAAISATRRLIEQPPTVESAHKRMCCPAVRRCVGRHGCAAYPSKSLDGNLMRSIHRTTAAFLLPMALLATAVGQSRSELGGSADQERTVLRSERHGEALFNQKRFLEARPLLSKACASGRWEACDLLTIMYVAGLGGLPARSSMAGAPFSDAVPVFQCRAALKSRISRLYFSMIFHTLTAVS